jgi:hypothetical protein
MIVHTPNVTITPNMLLEALENSYSGLLVLQEEKQLEKRVVLHIIDVFKQDCDYIKSILTSNHEKAKVDELSEKADQLVETVKSDPDYLIDKIREMIAKEKAETQKENQD